MAACITVAQVVLTIMTSHPNMREVLFETKEEIEDIVEGLDLGFAFDGADLAAAFFIPGSSELGVLQFFQSGCIMGHGGVPLPSPLIQIMIFEVKKLTPA